MPDSELVIQNRVMLALGAQPNSRIFRNNTGAGWVGRPPRWLRDAMQAAGMRKIRFGLGPGTADLVGWVERDGIARFAALEVKRPGQRVPQHQQRFLDLVRSAGGLSSVVHSVEEARSVWLG